MAKSLLNFFSITFLKEKVLDNKNCWQLIRAFFVLPIFITLHFKFNYFHSIMSNSSFLIRKFLMLRRADSHYHINSRFFYYRKNSKTCNRVCTLVSKPRTFHLSYPWSPTFYLVDCAICIVWRITSETFLN